MAISTEERTCSIRLQKNFPAPVEKVFAALTEQDLWESWFLPKGCSFEVEWPEPVPGGRLNLEFKDGSGARRSLSFLIEERSTPTQLSHTWAWEDESYFGENQVRYQLSGEDGNTKLELYHGRFPERSQAEAHEKDWLLKLDRLAKLF